jgi:hypothetical protein
METINEVMKEHSPYASVPTNKCTLSSKMKVGMQQNKIRSLGEFASSSNVGLTAGDTMSQLIYSAQRLQEVPRLAHQSH